MISSTILSLSYSHSRKSALQDKDANIIQVFVYCNYITNITYIIKFVCHICSFSCLARERCLYSTTISYLFYVCVKIK